MSQPLTGYLPDQVLFGLGREAFFSCDSVVEVVAVAAVAVAAFAVVAVAAATVVVL